MDRASPTPREAAARNGGGASRDGGEFQSPALERLVRALGALPGLGRKSATRIALDLVQGDGVAAEELAGAVTEAREAVCTCSRCGAITEDDPCRICSSTTRDPALLCVVASPVDVLPFERAGFFRGRYFVLGKLLSPLDGVRVDDLPFDRLDGIVRGGVTEMILALDNSVEGEATALYIQRMFDDLELHLTRLATGIPVGGALAYTDEATLQRAYQFRRDI